MSLWTKNENSNSNNTHGTHYKYLKFIKQKAKSNRQIFLWVFLLSFCLTFEIQLYWYIEFFLIYFKI